MLERSIIPSGCRHCGEPQRLHCRQWVPTVGWHAWEQPTDRQILARMRIRRATRLEARRV
ncbi:hypothetical protein GTW69_30655 [Streptomyces sp. SID7760]|nr:hypothetical protein [Streptomyces sp. SID7760]